MIASNQEIIKNYREKYETTPTKSKSNLQIKESIKFAEEKQEDLTNKKSALLKQLLTNLENKISSSLVEMDERLSVN